MRQWNCLCCARPIEKDLICCFLATGFPTVYLLTSFSSSLACSLGIVQIPDAASACCMQYAVVTPHRPGVCGAEVGMQDLHSITQPLWLNFHCEPVRPLPKRTCCRPLEEVRRGGTALDMGLQAICPQNNLWLVPIKDVCQFISIFAFLILGVRGEFWSFDFGSRYI